MNALFTNGGGRFLAVIVLLAAAGILPLTARSAPFIARSPKERTIMPAVIAHEPVELTAGPIRCRFADGELRYLYVGDREIVRRVYFAVRDGQWNTAMPHFTKTEIHQTADGGFVIELAADCRREAADFSWTGRIVGTTDGRITFTANGAASHAFRSNRIGLCVLYGAPALAGHDYETVGTSDGNVTKHTFPIYVSAPLVAPNYRTLRYTTDKKLHVTTDVTGSAHFDMEDQRTYSDSSFKAYAPLGYAYKENIPAGVHLEETVTISVGGTVPAVPAADRPITVHVGAETSKATLPKITQAAPDAKPGLFGDVNGHAERYQGLPALTWGFSPTTHLPDEDTIFENLLSLGDQVRSAHVYAPGATITLSPVLIDAPKRWPEQFLHSGDDPLQGAWSAALIEQAAQSGVSEVAFGLGDGLGRTVQEDLATFAGRPLRTVTVSGGSFPCPLTAFAVHTENGQPVLYLVNQTNRPRRVSVEGLSAGTVNLNRTNRASAVAPLPTESHAGGSLTVEMSPYEVCRISPKR